MKAQSFDLVIADMLMPDHDGIELFIEMKKEHSPVPVIAMSGGGCAPPFLYLQMAKGFGAAAVLGKPFNRAELFAVLVLAKASLHGKTGDDLSSRGEG